MVLKSILDRHSVRDYKTEPISDADILEIIKAAQFAPTAHNNRAVEFLVVKDQVLKNQLFEILGQEFIRQAPVLLIPLVDQAKAVLPVQDLSVASAHIFLQATDLGLGSVWKNLSPEWAAKVRAVLSIPDNYQLVNIIPLGYAKHKHPQHSDSEFSQEKIHYEKFA